MIKIVVHWESNLLLQLNSFKNTQRPLCYRTIQKSEKKTQRTTTKTAKGNWEERNTKKLTDLTEIPK